MSHESYHVAWFSKNILSIISLGFTSRSLPSVFEVPLWQGLLLASSLVGTDLLMEVTKGANFKANDLQERSYQLWAQAMFFFLVDWIPFYRSIMMWLTLSIMFNGTFQSKGWSNTGQRGLLVDWGQSFQWNVPLSLRRVRPGSWKTHGEKPLHKRRKDAGRMIHESDPGHQGWQNYHLGHGYRVSIFFKAWLTWLIVQGCSSSVVGGWINEGKSSCL